MQIRPEPRFSKRVPCRVTVAGTSYQGTVVNLSWTGLFVETPGLAEPGSQVWLELWPESSHAYLPKIRVTTQVIWKRETEAQRREAACEGVGLRIRNASESYYDFLLRVAALPYDA